MARRVARLTGWVISRLPGCVTRLPGRCSGLGWFALTGVPENRDAFQRAVLGERVVDGVAGADDYHEVPDVSLEVGGGFLVTSWDHRRRGGPRGGRLDRGFAEAEGEWHVVNAGLDLDRASGGSGEDTTEGESAVRICVVRLPGSSSGAGSTWEP